MTQVVFLSISHCSSGYATKWNQHCYIKHFEFTICTTLIFAFPPPPPPPRKKECINCVFHFPWVFQSMTVNVFQALYQTSQTIKMNFEKLLGFRTRFLKAKLQSVLISFTLVHPFPLVRGNPIGLFLKNVRSWGNSQCWVGDVEEIICSSKESVAGKNTIQGVWGDLMSRIAAMC